MNDLDQGDSTARQEASELPGRIFVKLLAYVMVGLLLLLLLRTLAPEGMGRTCNWTGWHGGPGVPEAERALSELLASAGIEATVASFTYGENNSCSGWHLATMAFVIDLPHASLDREREALVQMAQVAAFTQAFSNRGSGLPRAVSEIVVNIGDCQWQLGAYSLPADHGLQSAAHYARIQDGAISPQAEHGSCPRTTPQIRVIHVDLPPGLSDTDAALQEAAHNIKALLERIYTRAPTPTSTPGARNLERHQAELRAPTAQEISAEAAQVELFVQLILTTPDGKYCLWDVEAGRCS